MPVAGAPTCRHWWSSVSGVWMFRCVLFCRQRLPASVGHLAGSFLSSSLFFPFIFLYFSFCYISLFSFFFCFCPPVLSVMVVIIQNKKKKVLVKYDDQVDHYSEYRNATPVKVNLLGIFWPSDNNSDVKLLDGTRKKKPLICTANL